MSQLFGGGRRTPYTAAGIRRLTCARYGCTNMAHATWQVCADDEIFRPLCLPCDIELNRMVLKWFGDPDEHTKVARYAAGRA